MTDHPSGVGGHEAFWTIGQIRLILEPGFAYRVKLAHEEGLLDAILAGREEEVLECGSRLISALSARVHWRYPQELPHSEMRQEDRRPDLGISRVTGYGFSMIFAPWLVW